MRQRDSLVSPDMMLLGVVLLLVTGGVVLVFDASYARMADAKWAGFDSWYMVKRQLIYAVTGLLVMYAVSRVRLSLFIKITLPLLFFSLVLLIAVMVPHVGYKVNGAYRWLKLGPISFQPSEFAKLALVLYLAGVCAKRNTRIRRLFSVNWVIPAGVVGLIAICVFVEPDLGTALAIVGTCFIMLIAAGALKRHIFVLGFGGASLVGLAILVEPYRMDRIWTWLNPWRDRYGEGYQIIHSLIALGTGGLHGVGLCEGREKLYLPAASTDFIFATLGEEAGLIGGLLLLGAFMLLTYRGLEIARKSKSTYGNLLAVGVTSMITLQSIVNISVVSAAIPATGVPLPFISYGGSSLLFMLVGVGILLSISTQVNVEIEERDLNESSIDGRRDRGAHLSRRKHRPGTSRVRPRR